MRIVLLLALVALAFAGCASTPPQPSSEGKQATAPVQAPTCVEANENNYGTNLNGNYIAPDGTVWKESNGIPNLQVGPTCKGQADTRVA